MIFQCLVRRYTSIEMQSKESIDYNLFSVCEFRFFSILDNILLYIISVLFCCSD